jgi:hypothetical protein
VIIFLPLSPFFTLIHPTRWSKLGMENQIAFFLMADFYTVGAFIISRSSSSWIRVSEKLSSKCMGLVFLVGSDPWAPHYCASYLLLLYDRWYLLDWDVVLCQCWYRAPQLRYYPVSVLISVWVYDERLRPTLIS